MRILYVLQFVVLTAMLGVGCDNGEPDTDEITVEDFVGSWTASSHTFTNNADQSQSFDTIANDGETRTTVLTGGGTRTWFELGTFSDEWDSQMSINGTTLTMTPVETTRETRTWTFTLEGTVITLTDATSSFDFTLSDAAEVSSTEVVVLVRTN